MTASTDIRHAFVQRPIERAHGPNFFRCDLCSRREDDPVHELADQVLTSGNDMDPVSGLPYHDYVEGAPGNMGGQLPSCKICGFGSAANVHNKPPFFPAEAESTGSMINATMIAGEMSGAPCVACGKSADDPDHDNDVDTGHGIDTDADGPQSVGPLVMDPKASKATKKGLHRYIPPEALRQVVAGVWTETAAGSGTMVALYPEPKDARKVALPGDNAEKPKDLHVTVAHLPNFDPSRLADLHNAVGHFAARTPPIAGRVSGKGEFAPTESSDNKPVTYASMDVPGLAQHHVALTRDISGRGIPVSTDHGFTPHMTLAYDKRKDDVPEHPMNFSHITVAHGDQRTHFPLTGMPHDGMMEAAAHREHIVLTDRVEQPEETTSASAERAFFTEANGKTLLTAPAYMVPEQFQKAQSPNNFMKYMAGRFVGGEKANRNGAFWSVGDLEFGMPTVAHGPLNWLHEARHIIGTITAADLVKPTSEQAAEGLQPHIQAMAGMWAWVYPDEVAVIEQAGDQGKLYYSMECVSNEVACVGEGSCGTTVPYLDYIRSAVGTCQHMKQRAGASRRFAEPTFLGGAAIVPPVRPGWADAHASVMKQAASLAEKAFEQAGQPDVSASDWELLMSQVLLFAGAE